MPLEDTSAASRQTAKEGHPWQRVLPVQSHRGLKVQVVFRKQYLKEINCWVKGYVGNQEVHGLLFILCRHPSAEK